MLHLHGHEWVTTGEAVERLGPEVSYETLRNWYAPRGGRPPRVRLLRNPAGLPVRQRGQVLLCWADAVEAERATRLRPAGRPRQNGAKPA